MIAGRKGLLVLFGGPAGAGKTAVAKAWCATRELSVFIELDTVRDFILGGRADPQRTDLPRQPEQHFLSVAACQALARVFLDAGYDVALEEVFPAGEYFEKNWRSFLEGVDHRIVILLPDLDEALARSRLREKNVLEQHTRTQHEASLGWPEEVRIDSTKLSLDKTLEKVRSLIDRD